MKAKFKYLLPILFLAFFSDLSAQIGFRSIIGLNFATISLTSQGKTYSPRNSTGINFGGSLELPLARNLYFEPALIFSAKGSVYRTDSTEYSISPIYLEVPLILSYSFGWDAFKVTIFAGPYFACGVGGNTLMTGGQFQNIIYGSGENDDLKRFDIGLKLGGGFNIKGFLICAQYGSSLTNISPTAKVNTEMKNKVFGITLISPFGQTR
jgi:hypothetical protein